MFQIWDSETLKSKHIETFPAPPEKNGLKLLSVMQTKFLNRLEHLSF